MAEIVDFGLQHYKIKMDSRYFENTLSVVVGDIGRRIEVQLLDTNGLVQDTTGLSLRLNAEIAGKATFTDATLVDAATGKYRLDLSNGMFLAPGNWQFQWKITDSTGKKLHSFAFTGNIGKNISEGGSQATNFYLNLEDLKAMQEDLANGTFALTGKNKFNIDTLGSGYYGTDGILYPNDEYGYSDYIVVKGGEEYVFSRTVAENTHVRERVGISFISAYSNIGILPKEGGRNVSSYIVPEGVTRIRLSSGLTVMNRKLQMEFGTTFTAYEKYKRTIRYLKTTVENDDIVTRTIDQDKLRLPPDMIPKMFYFSNGTLNSGKFNSASSNRVATIDRFFAKKGSIVNVVGATDVEFTVHILTEDDEYVKNSSWSSTQYVFDSDCYFRISAKYMTDVATPESKLPYFNNSFYLSSNNPYSVVLKNEQSAGGSESTGGSESDSGRALIMPANYPVVVGTQANVYLDNILQYGNAYAAENFKVRGKGGIIEQGYQFIASSNTDLNFDYSIGKQLVMTKKLSVKAVPENAGSGLTKNVIMIGESTTPVELITELNRMFSDDPMNFVPMGTRGIGVDKHEGRGGWKISDLINKSNYKNLPNAFYNPAKNTFDFPWYMVQQGYTKVDYVTLLFGFNDMYEGQTIAQVLANYAKVIASIRLFDSSIKIGIGLTSLPSIYANLNGGDLKNDMLELISALIKEYDGRESEGFYIIPVYLNVDPINDMQTKQVPISLRNPKTTTVGDDLPHPESFGYLKFADVYYNMFKYMV